MMFTNEDSALQYIIVRTLLYAERMHDHRKRKKEISMLLFEGYNSIRNLFFLSYIPYKPVGESDMKVINGWNDTKVYHDGKIGEVK